MSFKVSPRSKRQKNKEDPKYETVVQVHKILKTDTSSSDRDNLSNLSLSRTDNSEDGESNKAFQMDDFNDNYTTPNQKNNVIGPSREISVDGDTQISSKIMSLIETEMKRDINKHSHFTDSRPQSLSFYEDEKIPEELSGNLELLSPEERKHYRKKKDHNQLDTDDRKTYNAIQDLYASRDGDEISTTKKSKSRKKKHADPELGMGDSREMMIPKEKKKSKKKKRESTSPSMSNNTKRKHKRRDEDVEVKTDITIALEELQDDVFENIHEENNKAKRVKETVDYNDRLYVQRKNKFEVASSRPSSRGVYKDPNFSDYNSQNRSMAPLNVAICIQKYCMNIFLPCHGILAGLAFGQWLYLICNAEHQTISFLQYYSRFSDVYITIFHFLIIICLVSSLDRIDIAHINKKHFFDFSMSYRIIGVIVIILYAVGLILHLSVWNIENKIGLLEMGNVTEESFNLTITEIRRWNHISLWRFLSVLLPWILVAATASDLDNMLYVHLQSMLKYLPEGCFCR